jgi:hypothetical protein
MQLIPRNLLILPGLLDLLSLRTLQVLEADFTTVFPLLLQPHLPAFLCGVLKQISLLYLRGFCERGARMNEVESQAHPHTHTHTHTHTHAHTMHNAPLYNTTQHNTTQRNTTRYNAFTPSCRPLWRA